MKATYSVVIPVFNSETMIGETVERVKSFFKNNEMLCEIILVNDGSRDHSWDKIKSLALENKNITSVNFVKNYGQHTAIFCGMQHAKGDFLITLDDDLQNPPEEIGKLIKKINEGYDLVFARFSEKKHSYTRRIGSRLIGFLNYIVYNKPRGITLSNFRIFTKEIVEKIKKLNVHYPYIPGLLLVNSERIANVETKHEARRAGHSNYTFLKIFKLIWRMLFLNPVRSLRILNFFGIKVSGEFVYRIMEIVPDGN